MKKRKQYRGKEKIAILRKHLLEGVSVSDICDEYGLRNRPATLGEGLLTEPCSVRLGQETPAFRAGDACL